MSGSGKGGKGGDPSEEQRNFPVGCISSRVGKVGGLHRGGKEKSQSLPPNVKGKKRIRRVGGE